MTNEKVATMIKHLVTYLPIYVFAKDGAEDVETIKRHLTVEYGKPESTARAQVNAIDDNSYYIKEGIEQFLEICYNNNRLCMCKANYIWRT